MAQVGKRTGNRRKRQPAAIADITAERLHGWFRAAIDRRAVPDMKLCAALAVRINAERPTIAEHRERIFGTDNPELRAACTRIVRESCQLRASLRRIKPFHKPAEELDAAIARFLLDDFGRRLTHAESEWRLWVACASTFAPLIKATMRDGGWRGPLSNK